MFNFAICNLTDIYYNKICTNFVGTFFNIQKSYRKKQAGRLIRL